MTTNIEKHSISELTTKSHLVEEIIDTLKLTGVFKNKGYVAGGFARKLYRTLIMGEEIRKSLNDFFAGGSDVDFFFHDDVSRDVFFRSLNNYRWSDSPNKNAAENRSLFKTTYDLRNCNKIIPSSAKVQAIKCVSGTPEFVLGCFDLVNSQFAFDDKHFWYNPEALELERKKILKAERTGDLLGVRLSKYYNKHDYASVEKNTTKLLIDWIKDNDARSWSAPQGSRNIVVGSRLIVQLCKTGLLSGKLILPFLGRFLMTKNYCSDYSAFERDSYAPIKKITAAIDEIEFVANKRNKLDIMPGDLLSLVPGTVDGVKWQNVIAVSKFDSLSYAKKHWRVLSPDGRIVVISTDFVKQVIRA